MPLIAFIRIIVRFFTTANALKEQYKEESEGFDAKHHISAPQSKVMSHIMVGTKILLVSLLMGDFEFLGEFSLNKFLSVKILIFIGIIIFLFVAIIMIPCEKQNQRNEKMAEENMKFRKGEMERVCNRRKFRKNSKSIHEHGI